MRKFDLSSKEMELVNIQPSIDFEYQLNDGRINGLFVLNTILFGVIGVLITGLKFSNFLIISIAVFLVALFGWKIATIARRAICSGVGQIIKLKKRRENIIKYIRSTSPYKVWPRGDLGTEEHYGGILPYVEYPKLFENIWISITIASAITVFWNLVNLVPQPPIF